MEGVQGENIRQYMTDIPRREPMPLIHIYVDLHLCSLHQAGYIEPPFEPPPEVEMVTLHLGFSTDISAFFPYSQYTQSGMVHVVAAGSVNLCLRIFWTTGRSTSLMRAGSGESCMLLFNLSVLDPIIPVPPSTRNSGRCYALQQKE